MRSGPALDGVAALLPAFRRHAAYGTARSAWRSRGRFSPPSARTICSPASLCTGPVTAGHRSRGFATWRIWFASRRPTGTLSWRTAEHGGLTAWRHSWPRTCSPLPSRPKSSSEPPATRPFACLAGQVRDRLFGNGDSPAGTATEAAMHLGMMTAVARQGAIRSPARPAAEPDGQRLPAAPPKPPSRAVAGPAVPDPRQAGIERLTARASLHPMLFIPFLDGLLTSIAPRAAAGAARAASSRLQIGNARSCCRNTPPSASSRPVKRTRSSGTEYPPAGSCKVTGAARSRANTATDRSPSCAGCTRSMSPGAGR